MGAGVPPGLQNQCRGLKPPWWVRFPHTPARR